MLKRSIFYAVISIFGFLGLLSCSTTNKTFINRHYITVPDDYSTIQEAIKQARNGDTIYIKNGIYKGNILLNKRVSIEGQSPEGVIIIPDENSNDSGIEIDLKENFFSLLFSGPSMIPIIKANISVSSLQIRNFKIGIQLAYENISSISNCIIVPPPIESTTYCVSLRLQGANTIISNCTVIGLVHLYGSKCRFANNIFANAAIQERESKFGFRNEKAIEMDESSDCTFSRNVIWGEVPANIGRGNLFLNPQFNSVKEYKYLSPYTKEDYGARIVGISTEAAPADRTKPEIVFKDDLKTDDVNLIEKRDYQLSFTVYDDSPILRISIATEEVDCGDEFLFQRTKYKKEITRSLLLHTGYNTLVVTAEDILGNRNEVEISFLLGELSIPRSDWKGAIISEDRGAIFHNRIGLTIGIQRYAKEFPQLKYTENDAKAIYEILKEKGYHMLPPLFSPTLSQIREALIELEKTEVEGDKIVIYISGHGSNKYSLFSDSSGLILPSDANAARLSTTALPMEDFRSYIRKLEAESVVIILDMCFASSGKGFGQVPKDEDVNYITETLKDSGKGKVLLASSGDMEESFEDDELKHGVFTYFLIEAIRNNKKSIDSIYEYIYNSIQRSGKWHQRPRKVFLSDDVEGIHLLF